MIETVFVSTSLPFSSLRRISIVPFSETPDTGDAVTVYSVCFVAGLNVPALTFTAPAFVVESVKSDVIA